VKAYLLQYLGDERQEQANDKDNLASGARIVLNWADIARFVRQPVGRKEHD